MSKCQNVMAFTLLINDNVICQRIFGIDNPQVEISEQQLIEANEIIFDFIRTRKERKNSLIGEYKILYQFWSHGTDGKKYEFTINHERVKNLDIRSEFPKFMELLNLNRRVRVETYLKKIEIAEKSSFWNKEIIKMEKELFSEL